MRNVGIFVVLSLVSGIGAVVGCSSNSGGGSGGSTGTTTSSHSSTSTSSTSSTSTSSTSTSSGAGGGAGGGGALSVVCNPVTNAGCTNGDACDTSADSGGNLIGFACYMGPNTVADCASCDPTYAASPFCAPGSTCQPTNSAGTTGQCAHYCCTDADCGTDGTCAMTDSSNAPLYAPVSSTLGLCLAKPVGDGGVGDGGAGDAGAASQFACNAPATSPSAGSCVTLTQ